MYRTCVADMMTSSCRVALQLYSLLKQWPVLSPEVALELLHCSNTDLNVRQFAVLCLDETLTDDHMSQYLLQLVQVRLATAARAGEASCCSSCR